MTLYQISQQFLELAQLVDDEEIDAEVIEDTFEALEGEFEEKADGYACVIRNAEACAKALKEESARLKDRADKFTKKAEKLSEILLKNMKATNHDKFDTEKFSFKVSKGRGTVVVDDEEAVPFEYITTKTINSPNKTELGKYLKSLKEGETCAFAHLEFNDSLSLK